MKHKSLYTFYKFSVTVIIMDFYTKLKLLYLPIILKLAIVLVTFAYLIKSLATIDTTKNIVAFDNDEDDTDNKYQSQANGIISSKVRILKKLISPNKKKLTPDQKIKVHLIIAGIVILITVLTSLKDMYEYTMIYITFFFYTIHKQNFEKKVKYILENKNHKKTLSDILIVYIIPTYLIITGLVLAGLIIRTSFF